MRIEYITPKEIKLHWKKYRKIIARGIERVETLTEIDNIKDALFHSEMGMYSINNGNSHFILRFLPFPKGNVCEVWMYVGDTHNFVEVTQEIKKLAILNNCIEIRIFGRKGWERKLQQLEPEMTVERVIRVPIRIEE